MWQYIGYYSGKTSYIIKVFVYNRTLHYEITKRWPSENKAKFKEHATGEKLSNFSVTLSLQSLFDRVLNPRGLGNITCPTFSF